jgi:hypothetical protein
MFNLKVGFSYFFVSKNPVIDSSSLIEIRIFLRDKVPEGLIGKNSE